MKRLASLVLAAAIAFASVPQDPLEAHRYADKVAYLRMAAALNEWHMNHPFAKDQHELTLDRRDKERYEAAINAFKEWEAAMKRAGY